jgi:hypothetical protein
LLGHNLDNEIPSFRKSLLNLAFTWISTLACLALGVNPTSIEADDVDYSFYLGKGYTK